MDDPKDVVVAHIKEQFEGWAGMYLGLPPDHEFTQADWVNLGQKVKTMLGNLLNMDELYVKTLQAMPDEKLDEIYTQTNKRLTMLRKEIARRHGG